MVTLFLTAVQSQPIASSLTDALTLISLFVAVSSRRQLQWSMGAPETNLSNIETAWKGDAQAVFSTPQELERVLSWLA